MVVLTGTLAGFHLPVIGVAILLGIDQILDMGRTTVNLIGNCVATAVVAKWENAFDYEKMHLFIKDTIQSKKNIQIKEFTKKQTKVEAKEENYTSI